MTDINNTINVPQPGSPRFQSDTAKAIGRIRASLGGEGRPYFQTLTLGGLTASRLIYGDTDKTLQSVTDLTTWVAGTANEVTVADDGDGTITIGLADPVIVGKGGTGAATLTDHSILLGSGTDPITSLGAATNGQLPIGSTGADPVLATLTGTTNQVTVINGAGTITLSGPQDIHTGATPTFVGVELDNSAELRYETSLAVGGASFRSYRGSVAYGSTYVDFYRARGNSLATIATVVDGDWATKWRMSGWTGAAYVQFGGFLYDMYDVSEGYGKFVFYRQTTEANYIAEIGAEYSRFGDTDGTDYVNISSTTGQLSLAGDARVVHEIEIRPIDFSPGASGPTAAVHGVYPTNEFTIDDDMYVSFEVPEDWDSTTDVTVSVYWAIDEAYATNSGEVQWYAAWSATPAGEVVTAPTHTGTIDFGDVNIPAVANTLVKTSGTIAAASLSAGDAVGLHGSRVALDDGSDPTAEPYILRVEIEYTANALGGAV